MAVDERLKFLLDWRGDIEQQIRDTTKGGASEVSDSDASVRRLALISMRTEWKEVNRMVNSHVIEKGGGDSLFGFRLKQERYDETT